MSKNFFKNKYTSGLTIIELLVVVSIFVIVTGLSIFNYKNFNSSIGTQNLADDIALTVRKAQGYAIGVRGEGEIFNSGYGIYFSINKNPSSPYLASNTSFILFVDIDNDGIYDYKAGDEGKCGTPDADNECLEVLSIKSLDEIKDIYLNDNIDNVVNVDDAVSVLFHRPNPEPIFYDKNGYILDISSVKIKVTNLNDPDNIYKFIRISNTGQISISNQWDE